MKYLMTGVLVLFPMTSFAFADVAVMAELLSTTIKQLNEMETLVSNSEKYTQKVREYNELAEDNYFRAERTLYLAEEMAAKKDTKNLGELNGSIRELKYNMAELKELMQRYANVKEDEKRTETFVEVKKKLNEKELKQAQKQVSNSISAKNTGRASQLTAQNTALLLENQVKMQETQLEILKTQKMNNRLKAEELEDKRLEEMNRLRFYNKKMSDKY